MFPILTESGKVDKYFPFECRIYFYGKQKIYQNYYYQSENEELPGYFNNYFIFSQGEQYGLLIDSSKQIFGIRVPVDSMLSKVRFHLLKVDTVLKNLDTVLISSKNLNEDIQDTYSWKHKQDTTMDGQISLQYTSKGFKDLDYSFSEELDKSKKMKLFKMEVINNPRFIKELNMNLNKVETYYLLEEISIFDEQAIIKLFDIEKEE